MAQNGKRRRVVEANLSQCLPREKRRRRRLRLKLKTRRGVALAMRRIDEGGRNLFEQKKGQCGGWLRKQRYVNERGMITASRTVRAPAEHP